MPLFDDAAAFRLPPCLPAVALPLRSRLIDAAAIFADVHTEWPTPAGRYDAAMYCRLTLRHFRYVTPMLPYASAITWWLYDDATPLPYAIDA